MAFFLHPLYLDWYEGAFLGKRRSKPLHRGSPLHVSPGRYMDTGWEHQQRMKIWQPVVADPPPKSQNLPVDETQNTPASKFTASFVVVAFYSLSRVRLFVTWWTVAHEAPPSMGCPRQEYWSGLPFPSPGDLPRPGIKPRSPALQADSLQSELPGKSCFLNWDTINTYYISFRYVTWSFDICIYS